MYLKAVCFAIKSAKHQEEKMTLQKELEEVLGKSIASSSTEDLYSALSTLVQNRLHTTPSITSDKKLYYISAEFLIGKQLGKNLINLGIYEELSSLLEKEGKSLQEVEEMEKEPSLGNGGLGRLAACFLDSIATLHMCGDGVGLNYHFGLFKQEFSDNKQVEVRDAWITKNNCILRDTSIGFPVELAGKTYTSHMYDVDILGYKGEKNTLHLFDLDTVDASIIREGITFDKTDIARNLTLFLYPDDSDENGRLLRIYQQYFMVSNAAQLILKEERGKGHDLKDLDKHVAIQINDTHPSMIIPELIRLLIKEGIPFHQAADIVTNTCGYTNHTILAEALEKWPLSYLEKVVPQLTPIIGGLDYAAICAYGNDPELNIIDSNNLVHMARMDMHFSHSINGVAALHTEILKNQELHPFYEKYPERFNNKTNGITFRRWILHCNPQLASFIDSLIGEGWKTNAEELEKLLQYYDDETVLNTLEEIKLSNKKRAIAFIEKTEGVHLDEHSVFDVQVKRLHEYKRQQLNALWVIRKYLDIRNGKYPERPITVLFGAKAAPAYTMAKDIIHLIRCLQQLINTDAEVSKYLKVVMLTNYNISKAEQIIPSADISEQISLASKEASGTGNMKFMLNGALTLGTEDGANVEIHQLVGDENIFTFGKSSDEVIQLYATNGYHPMDYYSSSVSIQECVDFITSEEMLSIGDRKLLQDVQDNLMHKDWFMTLLDFDSYCEVKEAMLHTYEDREAWKRKVLVNIAKSGFFSSDRTIQEYNRDIWHIQ